MVEDAHLLSRARCAWKRRAAVAIAIAATSSPATAVAKRPIVPAHVHLEETIPDHDTGTAEPAPVPTEGPDLVIAARAPSESLLPSVPGPDAPASPRDGARTGPAFVLRAGAEVGFRNFEDAEPAGGPRTYRAWPVPGMFVGGELALERDGVLVFEWTFSRSLGVHSKTEDAEVGADGEPLIRSRTADTTFTRIETAAKARWMFRKGASPAWVAGLVGFTYSSFTFDVAPRRTEVPAGTYDVLRAGVEGSVAFGRAALFGSAEFDELVGIGYLGDARPATTGPGTMLRIGASLELTRWLAARVDVTYTLWAYAMVRDVTAVAMDQYAVSRLGLEVRL